MANISSTFLGISSLNLFAGGDAVNGGKEVADAVQAVKDGARAILKYLNMGHG